MNPDSDGARANLSSAEAGSVRTLVVVAQEAHIAQAMAELIGTVAAEVLPAPARVLAACTSDDVLNILARGPIDVLIVEHHLANTTGFDLVRWLETGLANTVKILLTGDSRILAAPWASLGREFNAVLSRPLERQSLRQALERCIPRRSGAGGHTKAVVDKPPRRRVWQWHEFSESG